MSESYRAICQDFYINQKLGLKLDLQPIAWADWPLGLSSGKYDPVISNVGVTEQR